MLHKYTDTELKTLLSSIVILSDSREQQNKHILDAFDKKDIRHHTMKLDTGDYSFFLPENKDLGINRDMYFDNEITVERKNSLNELSNNIAQERTRFENELMRYKGKMILLVENNSYMDIFCHTYTTKLSEKAFFSSLMSFKAKYGIDISFVDAHYSWYYIHATFYYYLRNYLKNG